MRSLTNTLQQYIRIMTQTPFWRSRYVHSLLLACIVVVWGVVAFRIAQPRPHTLVIPDNRETIALPFVEAFTTPFRWVRVNERMLPTVITHLPSNMRIALAAHLFPGTEYVIYRGTLAVPYTNAPLIATIAWDQQRSQIAGVTIPVLPTRVFHFIAPLASAHDLTLSYTIADIRAQMRAVREPVADDELGVALTAFTSTPVAVSVWMTLLVVILQGAITGALCHFLFRWGGQTPVPVGVSSAFGLALTTLVSIYEFTAGSPQTSTVWWICIISLALLRLFPYIDLPRRLPTSVLFIALPVLVGGALAWYAPYASNGCVRTITPPYCGLTQMDYWVQPWQSLQQLPELVFPPVAGVRYSNIAPLPGEVQPAITVAVWVLTSLMVKFIRGWQTPLPLPLTVTIAGAALLTTGVPGMFPGILWMNVLEPTAYGTWETWLTGVASMRIPVSPLSLAIEGWLIHSAFGFGVYKWIVFRMMLIGVLVLVLFHHNHTRLYWWMAGLGLGFIACYSAYYTQMFAASHIAYLVFNNDIMLVFALVVLVTMLRRPQLRGRHVLAAGSLLAVADMTRPYMVLFTPILVILVCGYLWGRIPKHWLVLLCIPLIPIAMWHGNHILNLKQGTWSNHAGYNLCNAWPCPDDIHLHPESPRISEYRGINLNTEIHTHNSERLTEAMIAYNLQDPARALVRAAKLVLFSLSMPTPHVTSISDMRFPDVKARYAEWHAWSADAWLDIVLADVLWPPHQPLSIPVLVGNAFVRILLALAFLAQASYFWRWLRHLVGRLRRTTLPAIPATLRWHGVYAALLLGMYLVSSLSEFGENYRWVTMMGMAALYLPYAHLCATLHRYYTRAHKTLWG